MEGIQMDDSDIATIELSKGEASKVISALSKYEVEKSGFEDERILNIREQFQKAFGFEEANYDEDGIVEEFTDAFFEDSATEDVELARAEAKDIVAALIELEQKESGSETERIDEIQNRFMATFDLEGDDNPDHESAV